MERKDRLVDLLDRLDAQAVTEQHALREGPIMVTLWTTYHPPAYPNLPKRLRPLWEKTKHRLAGLAVLDRATLRHRMERRIKGEELVTPDGYTQLALL